MKTLYVSDLDGTLLGENATLTDYAKREITRLTSSGVDFTIATARSITTVNTILDGTRINVPVILLNGAAIYSLEEKHYLSIERLRKVTVETIAALAEKYKISGFFFEISDENHITHYDRQDSQYVKNYIVERRKLYGEESVVNTPFNSISQKNIVYFSVCDFPENLENFLGELRKLDGVHIEYYRDVYLKDKFFIEVASEKSSKSNGILKLKRLYGYDKIVSFGDNLNDIAMFSVSDESYAVSNAKPNVQEKASGIIGANTEDAVIKWLINSAKSNSN